MLTKAKLLRMPAKKYMAKEQLDFFQTQLTDQKAEALKEIQNLLKKLISHSDVLKLVSMAIAWKQANQLVFKGY